MKRILLALVFLLGTTGLYATENCSPFSGHDQGMLPWCLAVDAVAGTDTITSATINTWGFKYVEVQAWSAAGSSATVNVNCRAYSTGPWYPCYVITDASAAGKYVTLPRAYQYQVDIPTHASGTISVVFGRYN